MGGEGMRASALGRTLLVVASCLFVIVVACRRCEASASIPTWQSQAWVPTDGDVNFLDFKWASSFKTDQNSDDFYMYDFDDTNDALRILSDIYYSRQIFVHNDSGTWYASPSENGKDLDLGPTPEFGFFFSDRSSGSKIDYSFTGLGGNQYGLRAGSGEEPTSIVSVVDVRPVPIPRTAFLLASGLLGLMGVGLRRRGSKA